MLTKVLALGLLCCAFVPLLRAGTRNSPQITINKDPQAIAVVQSALTAMGGTAAYQDSVANGTSNEDGVSTPVVFKSLGTQLFRADYAVTGGTTSYILNQGIAVLQKFDGTVRSLSTANTFGQRVIHVPVGSLLAGYGDSNVELSYSGTTQLNGSTADIITMDVVDINDGSTADYWRSTTKTIFYLDHSSGFLLQVQYLTFAENDPSNPKANAVKRLDSRPSKLRQYILPHLTVVL